MSAYCSDVGYNGDSGWFIDQYREEVAHGMKLFKYLEDQGAKITLSGIKNVMIHFLMLSNTH